MASINKRPNGRWQARYYDADRKQQAKDFQRKVDAQAGLTGSRAISWPGRTSRRVRRGRPWGVVRHLVGRLPRSCRRGCGT